MYRLPPPSLSVGERARAPILGLWRAGSVSSVPLESTWPEALSLPSTDHYRVSKLTTEASGDQGRERHPGARGKGQQGDRNGRGAGRGREVSWEAECGPSSLRCCPQTAPLEGPKQDQGRCPEAGGKGPYVFRMPRACSNSCRLCCTYKQRTEGSPVRVRRPGGRAPRAAEQRLPWSRSTDTRPPAPRAGSKTRLCALPRGCPPRRSWSGSGERHGVLSPHLRGRTPSPAARSPPNLEAGSLTKVKLRGGHTPLLTARLLSGDEG